MIVVLEVLFQFSTRLKLIQLFTEMEKVQSIPAEVNIVHNY